MKLKYVKVTRDNFIIAYDIQKSIWPTGPDYDNFEDKAKNCKDNNISWIVYQNNKQIGITGIYVEDIDNDSVLLDWYGVLPEYRKKGFGKQILLDTIKYCKELNRYDYFKLDTTYWNNRPAILLYDKVMHFKEEYKIEDENDVSNNWFIYTYCLKDKKELWNNKNLHLSQYYKKIGKN